MTKYLKVRLVAWTLLGLSWSFAQEATDRWWKISLSGQAVGYLHEATSVAPGKTVRTSAMEMVLNRMQSKVEFSVSLVSTESPEGEFQSAVSEVKSSAQSVKVKALRRGGEIEWTTEVGGKTFTQTLKVEGQLLGPVEFQAQAKARLRATGDRFSAKVFVPELGKPGEMTRTVIGSTEHKGQTLLKVEEVVEGLPGKQVLLVDEAHEVVDRVQATPFGDAKIEGTSKAVALAFTGGSLPEEMYNSALARSNVRLPDPRHMDRVVLRLRQKNPDLGWPDFSGPTQRVLSRSKDSLVLEVRRVQAPAPGEPSGEAPGKEFLQANPLIQSEDPGVAKIAASVVPKPGDPYQTVRQLQDWVAANMAFDAGIAMATAAEVAKDRRGTCVAFATLMTALARNRGVPARFVAGSVYEQGMWGGHAWSEVYLGGRWVPIDPTLYVPGPADAARFHFITTSLAEGQGDLNARGLQVWGAMDVEVLEYEIHGKTTKVAPGAKPYAVQGDVYRNPWLSLSVTKPKGTRFTTLDAIYPDATVLRVESPDGSKVRLEVSSGRLDAGGHPVWRLTGSGKRAPKMLQDIAKGMVLQ